MIIRNVSIRSKLILATSLLILLLILLSLIYLDSSRRLEGQSALLKDLSELNTSFLSLQNAFYASESLKEIPGLDDQIRQVMTHPLSSREEQLVRKTDQILALLKRFEETLQLNSPSNPEKEIQARSELALLGNLMAEFNQLLFKSVNQAGKPGKRQLEIAMALGIILLISLFILFFINLQKSFSELSRNLQNLSKGALPAPLDSSRGDEFGKIAVELNRHTSSLRTKLDWISSMSRDEPAALLKPEVEDVLGNALLVLSDFLSQKELQEISRNREDKKVNWISEGLAQLGEVLRSEREDVNELSYLIVQKLVTYMNMEMGALYVTNDADPEHLTLELTASYAYDRRKFRTQSLEWGEDLPGTCAMEKELIFITDVPADYFEVSSALGSAKPNCILLVPLKMDDRVAGVIELATMRLLHPFEIEFVESLSERIASSLIAVRNHERTGRLLEQSQEQAEIMKSQEIIMRENLEKLEQAQKNSRRKESEITGILKAMDQSTLVAELGLNGRFTRINEKFLMLLESSEDQVLGKLHSDLAMVDQTSDAYKAFWATLKEGKSISNTGPYKLFTGEEIWLQQTFTPIINEEGRVQRILHIATNITGERSLQEQALSREQEIIRSGLDMQTLNQALNSTLLKCELDAEGIIMLVNDKYCEVTGYIRKELLGRNYRLFLKDPEKDQFENIWAEVMKDKVYEGTLSRSKPDGEELWLLTTFSPVKDEAGTIYKVYCLGLDITEKKMKYQLLEDAHREIDRLKRRLTDYK